MKIEIYNYDMAGGDNTFDAIFLDEKSDKISIQAVFSGINANDATVSILQSLDKKNFDTIVDAAGNVATMTLDATGGAVSATLNISGFNIKIIKPVLAVNSVTAGTLEKLIIEW